MAHPTMAGFLILMTLGVGAAVFDDPDSSGSASEQSPAKVERVDPAADNIIPDGCGSAKAGQRIHVDRRGRFGSTRATCCLPDIPSNSIRKWTFRVPRAYICNRAAIWDQRRSVDANRVRRA